MKPAPFLVTALLIAAAFPAAAQLPIVRGRFWQNKSIQDSLKLTPAQIERMDAIYWQTRDRLVSLDHQVDTCQLRLEKLLNETTVPAQAADAVDAYANSKADLEKATIRMLLRVWAELTPTQWKELRSIGLTQREQSLSPGAATPPRPHTPELDRSRH